MSFESVARRLFPHARLVRAVPLGGGVSAEVTSLELALPDGRIAMVVVRRHGPADLARNPRLAAHEYQLLATLHAAGLPVPRPLLLDEAGDLFPTPYLVSEYLAGAAALPPGDLTGPIEQIAAALVQIHRLDPFRLDLPPLPRHGRGFGEPPVVYDNSLDEARLRAALQAAWPGLRPNPPVLLHGDYWTGNLLWRDGRLSAVLDWEDAALGDPLADVANCRLELLWSHGPEAMRAFTSSYRALTALDFTPLPYWDLSAALRPAGKLAAWGLAPAAEARMRQAHHWFVGQALAALSGRSAGR